MIVFLCANGHQGFESWWAKAGGSPSSAPIARSFLGFLDGTKRIGDDPESKAMKGAFWWIDRWRKSTAYTDMNAEERGVYRELIDELWLRGGVIPNKESTFAHLAGGADVWKRVKPAVLAHFVLTDEGYRNETHDEVQEQSRKRADKQAEYRRRQRD